MEINLEITEVAEIKIKRFNHLIQLVSNKRAINLRSLILQINQKAAKVDKAILDKNNLATK